MADWITEVGLAAVVLWIVVDLWIAVVLKLKNGGDDERSLLARENRFKIAQHDKDIERIERKLDTQIALLNELNANVVALQTMMRAARMKTDPKD